MEFLCDREALIQSSDEIVRHSDPAPPLIRMQPGVLSRSLRTRVATGRHESREVRLSHWPQLRVLLTIDPRRACHSESSSAVGQTTTGLRFTLALIPGHAR